MHSLAVGAPPKLVEELSDVTVNSSQKACLKCMITAGDPKAKTTWYFNDKEIRLNKRIKATYENDEAVLTVSDAELKDAGWYRCEATNKLGRVETQCTLTVYSEY